MQPGRNDPCHCGSGRKYKHCCLHADERAAQESAGDDPVLSLKTGAMRRTVREAAATADAWEIEAIPLRISFDDEVDQRPVAVLVTASGLVLYHDVLARLGGEIDDVAAILEKKLVAAAREAGVFPPAVRIRHAEVADPLRERLRPRGVAVMMSETLPDLEDAARSLMEHLSDGANWPPVCAVDTWGAWGLPRTLVASLFSAAASYHRAAPWKTVENLQAPQVTLPSGRTWTATVLGAGGEVFGLALYSELEGLFTSLARVGDGRAFGGLRGRAYSLAFDPVAELPLPMQREIRRNGWEVGTPAYGPSVITINTPGGGLSRNDAGDLAIVLDAMPRFVVHNRNVFLKEQRTGIAGGAIEWRDAVTGAHFLYDGELMASQAAGLDEEPDAEFGALLNEAAREIMEQLGPDAPPADLMRVLDERATHLTAAYNDRPQPELGGLSPIQVSLLLAADWMDADSALRLSKELPLEQLADARLLANTRTLLALANERGGLPATQKGNLNVATVRELLEQLRFAEGREGLDLRRITEEDVWSLHIPRILAGLAGLLQRRKGKFLITRKGRTLLHESKAGELFALLFATYFRTFNLAYGSRFMKDWPALQYQLSFTFYRMRARPPEWATPAQLLGETVLPFALESAPEHEWYDLPAAYFDRCVLDALLDFGLAEIKHEVGEDGRRVNYYRKAALFDELIV